MFKNENCEFVLILKISLQQKKIQKKTMKEQSKESWKTYCEAIIIVKKYFSTMSYKVFNTSFEAVGSCIMESRVTPYIFGCNLHSFTLAYKIKLHETLLGVKGNIFYHIWLRLFYINFTYRTTWKSLGYSQIYKG